MHSDTRPGPKSPSRFPEKPGRARDVDGYLVPIEEWIHGLSTTTVNDSATIDTTASGGTAGTVAIIGAIRTFVSGMSDFLGKILSPRTVFCPWERRGLL